MLQICRQIAEDTIPMTDDKIAQQNTCVKASGTHVIVASTSRAFRTSIIMHLHHRDTHLQSHTFLVSKTSTASTSTMNEEEDLAVLIYKSSKTAKARAAAAAAAAAKEKEKLMNAPPEARQTTSTRKRSSANVSGNRSAKATKSNSLSKGDRRLLFTEDDKGGKDAPKNVARKKYRYECSADGCTNYAQQGGVCKRHGAKVKRCSSEGCTNLAQNGGVCVKHGAKVKRCSSEGCTNIALKGGMCMRHGAKVKRCSSVGCTNNAQNGGVCIRHGAKVKRCSSEGCTNNAQNGGVCIRHGAKVKKCSSEGCSNQARREGVCKRHGASCTLHDETTAFGSEFEKTTATLTIPNQNNPATADKRKSSGIPEEVVICQEIVEV